MADSSSRQSRGCFNSRTRKGCDYLCMSEQFAHRVSIHAPARGAIGASFLFRSVPRFNSRTRKGCDRIVFYDKTNVRFQFTHPQGVRFPASKITSGTFGFNSRTRKGCDDIDKEIDDFFAVSIHAPARGAIILPTEAMSSRRFNSRTRKGCDVDTNSSSRNIVFQFTHPQGVRCSLRIP